MEGLFTEFENENALRSYPFAAGCVPPDSAEAEIPPGTFVDAAIYPVDSEGTVYLSSISESGTFSVSDSTGVIMTGTASGDCVELYDTSDLHRHAGTLVASSAEALSEIAGRGCLREYTADNAAFAAGCVSPLVISGVKSLSVGGTGMSTGTVRFSNGPSDDIRASSSTLADGRQTLRFDVLARPAPRQDASIRRIICVVDGQTPFILDRIAYNTIALRLGGGIDMGVVCASAHREGQYEMADTCGEDRPGTTSGDPIPEAYQLEEVFIPPDESGSEGGLAEGADNAFFLVAPNELNYANPISITLEDGAVSPNVEGLGILTDGNSATIDTASLIDDVTSKGVVLQVPGLSGGK